MPEYASVNGLNFLWDEFCIDVTASCAFKDRDWDVARLGLTCKES
jgi:hypothetical protein